MRQLRRLIRSILIEKREDNYSPENPLGHDIFNVDPDGADVYEAEPYTEEEQIFLDKILSHIEHNDSGKWPMEFAKKVAQYANHPEYKKILQKNSWNRGYIYRGMTLSRSDLIDYVEDMLALECKDFQEYLTDYAMDNPNGLGIDFEWGPDKGEEVYGSRRFASSWSSDFESAAKFARRTFTEDDGRTFDNDPWEKFAVVLVAPLEENLESLIDLEVFYDMTGIANSFGKEQEWLQVYGDVVVTGFVPIVSNDF